jgi:hypothetical protein
LNAKIVFFYRLLKTYYLIYINKLLTPFFSGVTVDVIARKNGSISAENYAILFASKTERLRHLSQRNGAGYRTFCFPGVTFIAEVEG